MDFGGDFGSVLVEKNVWPFLVEKMGSPYSTDDVDEHSSSLERLVCVGMLGIF